MTLQEYYRSYSDEYGNTILQYCAIDDNDPVFEVAILFETYLPNGPFLDSLKNIIEEEFIKRYQNTDSRFFHVVSFTRVINAAYNNLHQNGSRTPIYVCKGNRVLVADDLAGEHNHLFTVEMEVEKSEGMPVSIHLEKRYAHGLPNRETLIVTKINPAGVPWDPCTSRFVDHVDAGKYNGYVVQYIASLELSVREELQEEMDETARADAEYNWDLEQQLDGEIDAAA